LKKKIVWAKIAIVRQNFDANVKIPICFVLLLHFVAILAVFGVFLYNTRHVFFLNDGFPKNHLYGI